MISKEPSLVDDFQQFFTVEVASTPEQLRQVGHVRYRVYCEEFHYEPTDTFPDGVETDQFDQHSLHCLITHKASQSPAGCVRLVERGNGQLLPMEKFCWDAIDPEYRKLISSHGHQSCEISRLAVDGQFRRRSGEHLTRFGSPEALDYSLREKRTFSLIAVAAYLSACAMADLTGRYRIYAMMEPFLPKLMQRSGIPFTRAGSDLDYHGLRAPYVTGSEEVVAGLLPELRELYDVIHTKFSREISLATARAEAVEIRSGKRVLGSLVGGSWTNYQNMLALGRAFALAPGLATFAAPGYV